VAELSCFSSSCCTREPLKAQKLISIFTHAKRHCRSSNHLRHLRKTDKYIKSRNVKFLQGGNNKRDKSQLLFGLLFIEFTISLLLRKKIHFHFFVFSSTIVVKAKNRFGYSFFAETRETVIIFSETALGRRKCFLLSIMKRGF
jgi:hypothetical protein